MSDKSTDDQHQQQRLKACLDILKHTPPDNTRQNILALSYLLDENDREALTQKTDPFPLSTSQCPETHQLFIHTEYNRIDNDQYRSPFIKASSNEFERYADEVFGVYKDLYYGKSAVSSVYCASSHAGQQEQVTKGGSFVACFAIVHQVDSSSMSEWNSVHVIEVFPDQDCNVQDGTSDGNLTRAMYKLISNIYISMTSTSICKTNVCGSLSKRSERTYPYKADAHNVGHLVNIGKMIEDIELDIRSSIEPLYLSKAKEIATNELFCEAANEADMAPSRLHTSMLNQAVLSRASLKNN